MNNKYKVGIIGCGMIFDRHIEAITANNEYFELVALCDIDTKKLEIRSKEYNVPGFNDYHEMLETMKDAMNFVVIATPNACHYDQARDALNEGYNVLVEKPVDFLSTRVKELIEVAEDSKKKAYAVLQVRYNPTVQMITEAIKNKLIGDIRSVSLIQRWQRPSQYFDSWRADKEIGGRTLYEVGIHYLDIVQLLFGLPDVKASCSFNNKHRHVEFEDTVFAIMQFPSGASGSMEITIAAEPKNLECSISIMGSHGYIKLGGKALDNVEMALFNSIINERKWNELKQKYGAALEPNSYGTHQGSCPNHPTLYREIAEGRGIELKQEINSIKFIEQIYEKEIR